ncbi:hypothetical protein AC249_AIPGENE28343 [Exaiptasia diaphana]|nr:hypothetical protein AC249_AIPGENE28343 [Exaiptasia diaphana]
MAARFSREKERKSDHEEDEEEFNEKDYVKLGMEKIESMIDEFDGGEGFNSDLFRENAKRALMPILCQSFASVHLSGNKEKATPDSRLKKMLENDIRNSNVKIKIVEKVETSVKRVLQRSNPFTRKICGREDCVVCKTDQSGRCQTQGAHTHKGRNMSETWRHQMRASGVVFIHENLENDSIIGGA